jgi:hypothetical protein
VAGGVVLLVSTALPAIPAWVLSSVLLVLTGVFLWLGRRAASTGSTAAARAWAGWAGATTGITVLGGGSLLGFGGALTATLLVVIAANAAIALWFGSGIHFAVVQVLGIGWGVLAHVFATPPWAAAVLAVAGLWWLSAVRSSRTVAVVTALAIPLSVALLLHPLTHPGAAVDGSDVALAGGLTALTVLIPGVVTDRAAPTGVWSLVRRTALVAMLAQIVAGAVPAVGTLLAPQEPLPGVFAGAALVFAAVAVWSARRTRPGMLAVLAAAAALVAVIATASVSGQLAASTVACAALGGFAVARIIRDRRAGGTGGAVAWSGLLAVVVFGVIVTGAPTVVQASLVLATGLTLVLVHTRVARS